MIVVDMVTSEILRQILKTLNTAVPISSVREYVFFVFFQISKNMTFYVFLKWLWKKRKKSVAKIFVLNDANIVTKKKKSLLNVYRNFGLKTPGYYRCL